MSDTLPVDPEGDFRTWLRSLASVQAVVGGAVKPRGWFQVPDDADETDYPLVTVERIGGTDDTSDAAIDTPLFQVTVVGERRGKQVAASLAATIRSELRALRWAPPTTWGASLHLGSNVESSAYLADPIDSRPRYVLTVSAQLTAA